jgi:hypothetical protein
MSVRRSEEAASRQSRDTPAVLSLIIEQDFLAFNDVSAPVSVERSRCYISKFIQVSRPRVLDARLLELGAARLARLQSSKSGLRPLNTSRRNSLILRQWVYRARFFVGLHTRRRKSTGIVIRLGCSGLHRRCNIVVSRGELRLFLTLIRLSVLLLLWLRRRLSVLLLLRLRRRLSVLLLLRLRRRLSVLLLLRLLLRLLLL